MTPVPADDNWLQKISLTLLNRTNKSIAYIQITLAFPETGDGSYQSPMRAAVLTLGQMPSGVAFNGSGQPLKSAGAAQPLNLAPGQALTVNTADYANQIGTAVSSLPMSGVTKVVVRRTAVIFSDGMRWDEQGYAVMPSNNPGHWQRLDRTFFPGTAVWPPESNQ